MATTRADASQSPPPGGVRAPRTRVEWVAPLLYAFVAIAWITLSDTVLGTVARSMAEQTSWSILKGVGFVAVSCLALHAGLRWALRRERRAHRQLEASEAALRDSEERYRSLFESSVDAIVAIDVDGRFTDANPAALRLLGYTREEMLQLRYPQVTPDRWHEMNDAMVRGQVATRGYSDEYEKEYIRKDGFTVPVSVRTFARRDSSGLYSGAWAIVRDITERKLSEEALNRSAVRFRTLIEKSTDLILILDARGRYRFFSPSATELLGWTAQEQLGKLAIDFVHPDDRGRVLDFFRSVVEGTPPAARGPLRYRYRHKDGSWRQIESHVRNCLSDVAVGGVVVNGRDVTEQRSLEEQFQQSQKLESVGRLAGGVAHDFNNLLTVILGCAESLQKSVRSGAPVSPEEVDDVREAGERARELTRQLLAFARKQSAAPASLDLDALVANAEKLLRRILGEDIELVTRLEALCRVRCDPGQMEQVVMNLAVNARDAMPGGGRLTIETALVEVDERLTAPHPWMARGRYGRLSLRDTGQGMPPEVMAHLFEPFFTTKPEGKGTGLGLATVYGIVKQAGGCVVVQSSPGQGACFHIYLPAAEGDAPSPTAPPRRAPSEAGQEGVLVVEDDPQVRQVTLRALRGAGYRVHVASQGSEALAVAEAEGSGLDLLITDVILPGGDGPSVAEGLRKHVPGLRVLYVSGYPQDLIAQRGVLAAGIEFLEKPFTPSSLLERVRAVLDAS